MRGSTAALHDSDEFFKPRSRLLRHRHADIGADCQQAQKAHGDEGIPRIVMDYLLHTTSDQEVKSVVRL